MDSISAAFGGNDGESRRSLTHETSFIEIIRRRIF